jgi:DNA-binding response OmpR family regulator
MFNILVVEDDINLNKLICSVLSQNGYKAFPAPNADSGLEKLADNYIDLVISDIMMPGKDGYEFATEIRKTNKEIPILFVTAKESLEDKQKGFDIGIDDYMVKPIELNELVFRVKALLRRAKIISERQLIIGNSRLDYDSLKVHFDNTVVELPQKEFLILYKLLSFPDKIFTRAKLMEEFWPEDSDSLERTVDVHITRIREKLHNNTDFEIVTIRGLGYKAKVK